MYKVKRDSDLQRVLYRGVVLNKLAANDVLVGEVFDPAYRKSSISGYLRPIGATNLSCYRLKVEIIS